VRDATVALLTEEVTNDGEGKYCCQRIAEHIMQRTFIKCGYIGPKYTLGKQLVVWRIITILFILDFTIGSF
jgi:hypothetical protein